MSASDFMGPSPLKFWAILRLYCKYIHTGPRYRRLENGLQTAIPPVYAYQIWWTLVHKRRNWDRSQLTQNQLFRTLISQRLRGVDP